MKKMLTLAALATLTLGGCAMDGQQRGFVPGINDDTTAQPIPQAGMWRMENGVVLPMGYAPTDAGQDQLVRQSAGPGPQQGMIHRAPTMR